MKIIKDVDPIYDTEKYDVILVGTSISGSMASGLQGKIARKYPYVDKENDLQPYRDNRRLGTRLTLKKEGNPIISLCYISKFNMNNRETVLYDSLENCLATANAEFKGKKVLTTIMGSTKVDGNGDRDKCLKIIEENTKDLDIDVYDYEQISAFDERQKICGEIYKYNRENNIKLNKKGLLELRTKKFKEHFVNTITYNASFY